MSSTTGPRVVRRSRPPALLRRHLGSALRRQREQQGRTLRDVSAAAGVSLGYLSEVERGVKEASSELLSAICRSLDVRLPDLLVEVADALYRLEVATTGVPVVGIQVSLAPAVSGPPGADAVDARAA